MSFIFVSSRAERSEGKEDAGAKAPASSTLHSHRLQRRIQAMLIEPLHIAPGPPAVLGRHRPFAPNAYWIDPSRCQGEARFDRNRSPRWRHKSRSRTPQVGAPLLPYSLP
jgi:hypothetical protein